MIVKFKKSTKNNVKFIDSDQLYASLLDKESLLVKIHDLVDFEYFKPILEPLYSYYGQHAYDCLLMLKLNLLQVLKSGLSDREVIAQAKTNLEYRYFLDLAIDDPLPHFTKVGDFRKRVGADNFSELFDRFVGMLKKNNIITKSDVRYMDATHQLADVSIVSINSLLASACKDAVEVLEDYSNFKTDIDLNIKDFYLSDSEKKERFVKLVDLANRLKMVLCEHPDFSTDKKIIECYDVLCRIIKERSKQKNNKIIRKNSDDKGKLASTVDKDATWGSKSKDYQFLGYKHNVTAIESGFIEVISTHPGHKGDEEFYIEDAKKSDAKKIVNDAKYGTLDNRKKSKKLNIQLVSPCRKNMKAHYEHKIMDEAFLYNKTKKYKKEMKKRGHVIEGIFGVVKKVHNFTRTKYRGINKVAIQGIITAFVINLKALVKWYDTA